MDHAKVIHISYGTGTVCEQSEKTVQILFEREDVGVKTFVYPDAFAHYLRYADSDMQSAIDDTLTARHRAEEERSAERAAARAALMEEEKARQKADAAARRKSTARTSRRTKKSTADIA